MIRVTVVDVGLGNVASVKNMLLRAGAHVDVAQSPSEWDTGAPVVLPGVGAWDAGIGRLQESGWFEALAIAAPEQPILGICLGMQMLASRSEEGTLGGIGRVDAHFVRFPADPRFRVPHMGWNVISNVSDDPIFAAADRPPRFYFTHSYYAICDAPESVVATATHGVEFVAAFRAGNTYGVQFHPEKSHTFGLAFLTNWLELKC
jgi:glutamine amidotransferase